MWHTRNDTKRLCNAIHYNILHTICEVVSNPLDIQANGLQFFNQSFVMHTSQKTQLLLLYLTPSSPANHVKVLELLIFLNRISTDSLRARLGRLQMHQNFAMYVPLQDLLVTESSEIGL